MYIIVGALAGVSVSAMIWDLSLVEGITNFCLASLLFGGGHWLIRKVNRHG